MNTCHLFAGRGGGLLADLILGHNPILAVEWNHEACENLREKATEGWYPNLHVWEGDVRMFDPSEYKGKVDCIHAGFPCQDISHAGNQAGVGEGTRSGLYREVLRIAGIIRPKYIFLENVAAIVTNGLGTVLGDISAMGYDARWCIVSASDVGANHQRERWWCLCTLRDTDDYNGVAWGQSEQMDTEKNRIRRSIRTGSESNDRLTAKTEARQHNADVANTNLQPSIRRRESQQPTSTSRKAWNKSEGCSNENAANTKKLYSNAGKDNARSCLESKEVQQQFGNSNRQADVPNTNGTSSGKVKEYIGTSTIRNKSTNIRPGNNNAGIQQPITDRPDWWSVESAVRRIYDGSPDKLHKDQVKARLFGLGNAQVPLSCAVAWAILTQDMEL